MYSCMRLAVQSLIFLFLFDQIKIRLNTEMPVQVDGEPWIQTPCEVVVLKSALKVLFITDIVILCQLFFSILTKRHSHNISSVPKRKKH